MNSLLKAGLFVVVTTVGAGSIHCNKKEEKIDPPTTENCKEVTDTDSRPVEGACLESEFATVDDLRKTCSGEVKTVIEGCPCAKVRVPVWRCFD